jgi:hypothetical protein
MSNVAQQTGSDETSIHPLRVNFPQAHRRDQMA